MLNALLFSLAIGVTGAANVGAGAGASASTQASVTADAGANYIYQIMVTDLADQTVLKNETVTGTLGQVVGFAKAFSEFEDKRNVFFSVKPSGANMKVDLVMDFSRVRPMLEALKNPALDTVIKHVNISTQLTAKPNQNGWWETTLFTSSDPANGFLVRFWTKKAVE